MGERKSKEYLNKLKEKYNVDELWSWSKYHTAHTDLYSYLLKYILHEKETKQSIYGISGGICHDILEKFYTKELTYQDMIKEYEMKIYEMELAGLKYNRGDEKKNESIADKYESNMKLFFAQHIPVDGKVICEKFVTIKVGEYVFQGYIDFVNKENEDFIITDFKTSTIYVGKKILEERGQLVLYAEALHQLGIPIENIKIRWNFLKYTKVNILTTTKDKETKLEKTKSKNCLRSEWVSEISKDLSKLLNKLTNLDELEIEDIVQTSMENNNLDNLPSCIKDRITKEDCYVYIPLDLEVVNELKNNIIQTLNDVKEKEKEYEITKDDRIFWTEIDKKNEYFFSNLCGYSAKQHKPYGEYLSLIHNLTKDDSSKISKDDMSWLNDL